MLIFFQSKNIQTEDAHISESMLELYQDLRNVL